MSAKHKNEKTIFKAALELKTSEERIVYVNEVCAGEPTLRERILALLEANEDKGDFLEVLLDEPVIMLDDQELKEKPGTVIGRYKLLEKIGEGGMAVVYMAEQEKPMRRKVALKIIKLGMDTKSVIARFEAERQALAIMDHPNIAKVFDAGATESGRPYFVMELVTGLSITEYCDQNNLSTSERLNLFIQVCNAVQHAHQKGIIHRDIKPSNIMVTLLEGQLVPKVIDFGIAKATKQRLTEKTLFTRYAHMIGTPAYMSPEQAELSDLEIDIRTDIYSLGILLYELLTGTTPFSEEQLRQAGYLEMQRIICQEEPTKPSTKLTALGEKLTDIAEHRGSTPDVLTRAVRGDLDWIVMKSIEKDRSRRYEAADGLAGDIQRHLSDEPILARPPEVMYRLQKFLRRHRIQVGAVLMLVILLGTIVAALSIWNQYQQQLEVYEPITHNETLTRARKFFSEQDFKAALKDAESILKSRHVGPEAQLLYASILVECQRSKDAVFILENLLNERPNIAGDARALLKQIYLDVELSNSDRLRIAQKVARKTFYVDVNAAGTNDGTSWADAYNSLQDALMAAINGDEIKVAAGVYKPDQGANVTPGDREVSFQLKQGVTVYGGMGGDSILSGDLNGDDGPDLAGNGENSYHVVNGSETNEATVLDSFTITAGNANGDKTDGTGGGMYIEAGSPKVTNCTFSGNKAKEGGGMLNDNSSPIVANCVFIRNSANKNGGGAQNRRNSSPTLTNCTFRGNSTGDNGGGMMNNSKSSPTLVRCTFEDNSAGSKAGGMGNNDCSPTVNNCVFKNNSATRGGGMCNSRGSPTVMNCLFSGNSAGRRGGGIAGFALTDPNISNIINCTFSENSASKGGALAYWDNCVSKLTNCIIWNNNATSIPQIDLEYSFITVKCCSLQGGQPAIYVDQKSSVTWDSSNIDSNPLFVNADDGDYHLQVDSPCVNAGDNSAIPPSITVDLDEDPRIQNDIVDMGAYECNSPLLHFRASNPSPVDRVNIGSVAQVELCWEGTSDVNNYKIYFSTDPDNLTLYGNVQQKNFMISPVLKNNCKYFWRVDTIQSDGSVIPGIVWSFSTVEGFDLYIDDIGPNIIESSWTPKGLLDFHSEVHPASGKYCIHWTEADLWDLISFRFSPIKDLSMLVSEGFVVAFWIRCDGPGKSIAIRFQDTKTDDPDDHPWRMLYIIDQRVDVWDGQWHHVQIPLYAFFENGTADDDGEWLEPIIGTFDWTAIEYLDIVTVFTDLKGIHFYFDDIRIVDPNPASLEPGIKPKVIEGKKDAD